uniref:adenylate kinase n=1 Tax=Chenopodium quinoa TaxID=63459 RepID=A0A803NCE6_CHEQI
MLTLFVCLLQKLQVNCAINEPLKVMISGAPASGKGTQCELIVQKFGLVHISTGDLLRAEVAAATEIGIKAKEYMNTGRLRREIITLVDRWLERGFPFKMQRRKVGFWTGIHGPQLRLRVLKNWESRPDVYIVLEIEEKVYTDLVPDTQVPDEILINRCVGRRLDPVTGKIYHINNFPPETEEIKERLVTRPDDTEEKVEISIPELDPSTDVYRIGTLMELVRVIALSFADDGKRVKVCVQGSMGEGALAGMPLQLAGTRKILEFMDWGDYEAKGTFINIGSIGGNEVDEQDDMFILVAPQNAFGNCIIDDLRAMTDAAGSRPVILINPRLKDLPGSSGIMQTMGRDKRLEYAESFENCYSFRLLYYAGTQYPIMGALRMSYPFPYEVYKRVDEAPGKEKYVMLSTFEKKPTSDDINNAFLGKPRELKNSSGFWGFLSAILS